MSGFGGNVTRKSKKSKGKKGSKGKSRNQRAIDRFNAGDNFAILELACEYQLEETLASGSYY